MRRAVTVRRPGELARVDGLVIPGGESTTMDKLARAFELLEPLRARIAGGLPVYGSCAGMIMLADRIAGRHARTSRPSAGSTSPCGATPSAARSTPSRRTCTSRGIGRRHRCTRCSSGRPGSRRCGPAWRCSPGVEDGPSRR